MATRLKTIEYGIPVLASYTDNTLTAMTTITAYIPEFSGTVTFRNAIVIFSWEELATNVANGNYNSRRIDVNIGGAGATSYTNSNALNNSGLNRAGYHAANATTNFQTNWTSGTSKTIAISILTDNSGATVAPGNGCAKIIITYEYDDTQTTQIKTIRIPLAMTVGALATSKPGSALATIPALDTELPEASKTYRNMFVTVQGNDGASTTDASYSFQIDTYTAYTSGTVERTTASDRFYRNIYVIQYYDSGGSNAGIGMTTNATHGWYAWGSVAHRNHGQAWLTVTYEFDSTQSNDCFNSVMLPMELASPMGGATSSDYQRATRDLWIEEPTTITTKQIAFYLFYDHSGAIAGFNCRVGTGSFVTYTDAAAVLSGGDGLMVQNDSAYTLARGKNTFGFDVYRTDTTDLGGNVCGFWIVNYTSGKPTQGYGAANHTVIWNLGPVFDGAAAELRDVSATAPVIPETSYFLNAVGTHYQYQSNGTVTPAGVTVLAEKTSGEGGVEWIAAYIDVGETDPESGLRQCWSQMRTVFKRWPNDADSERLDIETSRRWRCVLANNATSFDYLDLYFTYHTITFTVSGTITGSGGGTVNIDLIRDSDNETVLTTSRSGNGAYSFTWYDNTVNMFAAAREDSTHMGRSDDDVAV